MIRMVNSNLPQSSATGLANPAGSRTRRVAVTTAAVVAPQALLALGEHLAFGGDPINNWPFSTPHGWTSGDVTFDVIASTALVIGGFSAAKHINRAMNRRAAAQHESLSE